MPKRKYSYHRENCCSLVRATIKDRYGRKITLIGKHAFEWSIAIETTENSVIIQQFPNSKLAKKKFKELKK